MTSLSQELIVMDRSGLVSRRRGMPGQPTGDGESNLPRDSTLLSDKSLVDVPLFLIIALSISSLGFNRAESAG